MDIRPYLIVPKLIPQPTWGGQYIAQYKHLTAATIVKENIGQSYELSSDTMLTMLTDSTNLPIEIGDPSTGETIEVIGDSTTMFPLQQLIDQDQEAILGQRYIQKYGSRMQILIKFTQAKGNSFQVHVKPGQEFGQWKAKPESWYFLEPGKATLGLNNPTSDRIAAYKKTCEDISHYMQELSTAMKAGQKTPGQAKVDAAAFISQHSPFSFVNKIKIPKDTVIDLSEGGIHHSWEEGDDIPEGNIVYEVQLNVMDSECTLRSFDKGKIGDDGKIRPIHVDDYFTALDTDPTKNDPNALAKMATDSVLFDTPYYKTKQTNNLTTIDDSFVHVFVKDGELEIDGCTVRKGASLFIPQSYTIENHSSATLLQTYF